MTHTSRWTALVAGAAALAAVVGTTGFAAAQVNCDTMVGPPRSDCHMAVAPINRPKSETAATVPRHRTDAANLHRVRQRPKTIPARTTDRD
jgi:hypothetical protein